MTWTVVGEEYRSLSSSLISVLHSRYLVPLRPTYSPQHPILDHPQPTFLPQWNPHALWIPLHQDSSAECKVLQVKNIAVTLKFAFITTTSVAEMRVFHIADA